MSILNWKCMMCGNCCKLFSPLISDTEREIIKQNVSRRMYKKFKKRLSKVHPQTGKRPQDPSMWFIIPPCPFLKYIDEHKTICSIHKFRPYNCRLFECLRNSLDEPIPSLEEMRERAKTNPDFALRILGNQIEHEPWRKLFFREGKSPLILPRIEDSRKIKVKHENKPLQHAQCPYFSECTLLKNEQCNLEIHWKCEKFQEIALQKIISVRGH